MARSDMTPGEATAALYRGEIRPVKRDRYGEPIEEPDDAPALHGETEPPIRIPTRRECIERMPVLDRTEADMAYLEAFELVAAYPGALEHIRRAIGDAEGVL